jgi:oxygen-independent coproporphyrinogen-3 oxidase
MAFGTFGIYIHIPYCLQICPYCDFTKYRRDMIMPPEEYTKLLLEEIRQRAPFVPKSEVNTVYFGGGTPSLFEPQLILSVLDELANVGFRPARDAEITIEIDPTTVDEAKLDAYLKMGINRFSVGAQTFNDRLLKTAGRKHVSSDTVALLTLLKSRGVNYSFDLLFALPTQTLDELRADVSRALEFNPSHLSAYCLTVPEGHKLSYHRAPDEEQTEMFALIERELASAGIYRYEISNYARPGAESRHNLLYWTDQAYWGLGLSSHSYFPQGFSPEIETRTPWGARFWNVRALKDYGRQIEQGSANTSFLANLPEEQIEILRAHQALTDYCHTSLRLTRGLDKNALRLKFGAPTASQVAGILDRLANDGFLDRTPNGWTLSDRGRLVANLIFEKLTFLENEVAI